MDVRNLRQDVCVRRDWRVHEGDVLVAREPSAATKFIGEVIHNTLRDGGMRVSHVRPHDYRAQVSFVVHDAHAGESWDVVITEKAKPKDA